MSLHDVFSAMTDEQRNDSREAQHLYELIAGHWVSSTVRAAATLGIFDALADGASTVAGIAAAIDADPGGVDRLVRVCRSLGLLRIDGGTIEATRMGALLGSGVPGSLRALAMLQGTPAVWALWGSLPDAVRAGRTRAAEILEHSYFEHLAQHPAEAQVFHHAMRDLTALVEADAGPILALTGAPHVVDLGGGSGTFLKALLESAPEATGVVLERPHVLDAARATSELPSLGGRLAVIEGDFFRTVPDADLYVLKLVLHDWDDDEWVEILQTVARHARPDSRLLVVEALVSDDDGGGSPDLGALMDMTLLVMMSGRERSLAQYDELFTRAGWTRRDVRGGRSIYSFLELVPTPTRQAPVG